MKSKIDNRQSKMRSGFTLIEMLIVIAIIIVLVAMLLPAVSGVIRRGNETKNRSDISQLATSVQTFQTEFKVPYFPSRIHLAENYNSYNLSTQLDNDSVQFLTRMFPRIDLTLWSTRGIDWNGDVPYGGNYNGNFILEGDQCLVFFLGGIPVPPASGSRGTQGFSTNPADPAMPGGTRKGPFFEFQEARLIDIHGNGFYSYQDVYRNFPNPAKNIYGVYAYFSSYKQANGYNRYYPVYGNSDCASLFPGGVWPYAEAGNGSTNPRYLNPSSFQIISAGSDGVFAHGTPVTGYAGGIWAFDPDGMWTAGSASAYASAHPAGKDDMTNFYDSLIGVSQ